MDVKKLIVGFLILAVAAGASAFIISVVNNKMAIGLRVVSTNSTEGGATNNPGSSAFTEKNITDTGGITLYASTSTASSSDPNNLTDQLASAFVGGVVAANPNGLTDGADGTPTVTPPDTQTIAEEVASLPAATNLQVPDWDTEAESQPITLATSSSAAAVARYSNALNGVMNSHFIQTGISGMIDETNEDPSQVALIESQIKAALGDASTLATPPALVDFQESLVKSMVYEKNILALVQTDSNDPVKLSLVLQDEENKYNAAMQDLSAQEQKASHLDGFSMGTEAGTTQAGPVAMLGQALGIKTAHAQLFGGFVFDSANFGEWLARFANDIALQILKNTLTTLIQREVLTAIQGSGAPEFVQQWGATLVNSYQQSALNAINSAMSCVNPAFAPQMEVTLNAFYAPQGNLSCADSFQAALGGYSFQQFENNFSDGGFIAFGASMLPSGNYAGGLYVAAQTVDSAAETGQQATQAEDTSAGGFTGTRTCADGSNPTSGTHLVCITSKGLRDAPIPQNLNGTGLACPGGDQSVNEPNNGSCANGSEPQITTPGTFNGFSANAAIGSGVSLVTAANDIAGLLNAAANSLISTLSNTAIQAANSALNQGLSGGSNNGGGVLSIQSSTIQGGGTPPVPLPLACNPAAQNASTSVAATLGATGGTTNINGEPPTYYWTSSNGQTSIGSLFNPTYDTAGIYSVTLADSASDATATCQVYVQ